MPTLEKEIRDFILTTVVEEMNHPIEPDQMTSETEMIVTRLKRSASRAIGMPRMV